MRASRLESPTVKRSARLTCYSEVTRVLEGKVPADAVVSEARSLQRSSTARSALAVAFLSTCFFLAATRAQAPQGPQSTTERPPASPRTFSAPTNLQVLPKDLSGKQVHDIMEQWTNSLGVRCDSCHAEDHDNSGPDGRPRLNFADDSKKLKGTARIMYAMTEEINRNYIAKVDGSGMPVTCGTCHRGGISPEPTTAQLPNGPPEGQVAPAGEQGPQPK